MQLLVRLLLNALALLVVAYVLPGFVVANLWTAIVVAIVMGVVNTFIKPILLLVTLPITILTFGIFAFVLNVLLLIGVAAIVPGFQVAGFVNAAIASVLLALVSYFLQSLASDRK